LGSARSAVASRCSRDQNVVDGIDIAAGGEPRRRQRGEGRLNQNGRRHRVGGDDLLQHGDDGRIGEGRADTRAGEAVGFRERAEDDQVGVRRDDIRRQGSAWPAEVHISLIHHHDGAAKQRADVTS
jgi:hypothetical protein